MSTPYDINNNFKPHSLNPTQSWHCEEIRTSAASLAQEILDYAPDSRERSLALTNLEQAMFWANAAIARHPEQEAGE